MVIAQPPLQYLITSSQAGLESFVLSRQGQLSNLRREALEVLEEWIESETQLRAARWVLECRRAQDPDEIPTERLELADFEHPSQIPALSSGAMPILDQPSLSACSDCHTPAQLNGSTRDRPEQESVALSEHLLTAHPDASSRAEDALTFLEDDVRSQGNAIDAGTCNLVGHTAGKSVAAGVEAHRVVGECPTETLACSFLHPTVVSFSQVSARGEDAAHARGKHAVEPRVPKTVALGRAPGLKEPNPVTPIRRKVHDRHLLSNRAAFAEIRRRVV